MGELEFNGHSEHSEDAADDEYLPSSHDTQVSAESCPDCQEYVPAAQYWQTLSNFAAAVIEYLPLVHSVQSEEPFVAL